MEGEEAASMYSEVTRVLESARDMYDSIPEFNDPDALFNQPAPDVLVAFTIGGVLSAMGFLMWLHRIHKLKTYMAEQGQILAGSTLLRAVISCAIDSDSPLYVIVSYGAISFLFLGGIQLNYEWTLFAMVIFYFVASMGDSIRILLAFKSASSLADVVVTSNLMKSKLRNVSTELKPSNVYEDLGRGWTIVLMVFITQALLISFVCVDIFEISTTRCRDGTADCPVGGTFGSWGFYVLGIFMACVFQFGPKTSYGQSEQNPTFWLQLLLATKQSGAKVTWYDPVKDRTGERNLTPSDWRNWIRFTMSFLINGVGYHILVHALPIQVASQSSLTGVVFRAVGMMYLVDLDDTPGYTMTIVEKPKEDPPKKEEPAAPAEEPSKDSEEAAENIDTNDMSALSAEAHKIIEEARAKLDALAKGRGRSSSHVNNLIGGALLVAASTTPSPELGDDNDDGNEDGNLEVDDGGADRARNLRTIAEGNGAKSLPIGEPSKKEMTPAAAAGGNIKSGNDDADDAGATDDGDC